MQTLAKIGIAAAALACTGSAVFGTVSDNDVHRLTGTVSAVRFSQLAPGMMFEVVERTGSVTPICRYVNAAEAVRRDNPRHDVYYNMLGRNFPVPKLLGTIIEIDGWDLQVALDWTAYAEGLSVGFRGEIDRGCEQAAQSAHRRESVVCIVDSVLRTPGDDEIVAVRFKPYGFTPEDADDFPLCPLTLEEDVFWLIRRPFISVTTVRDDSGVPESEAALALAG
jgi:hypothetical protein